MKRLLLVLVVATLVALAGCAEDPDAGDGVDDIDDGVDDMSDIADENGDDSDSDDSTADADDADATDDADETDAVADDTGQDDADDDGQDDADDAGQNDADDDAQDDTDDNGQDEPEGELELHHIDVGQADSTLIVTPEQETILIDTGDWRPDGEEVISYLEGQNIDRIDHLVATHAHADHIGGHAAVIEHFEEERDGIGAAYDSGVAHDTQTYENYLDAIEEYDVDLFEVGEGDELPLDGAVDVTVLNPPAGDSGTDLHYNSITLALEFGEFRYLTTGDAETDAESRLLEDWADELDADLYQAGHHGSSTSSTEPFVEAVAPDIVLISSALDSQFGHPHDVVLERFASHDIEAYWTAVHGDVVFTSDGDDLSVQVQDDETTDPLELKEMKPEDNDGDDSYSAVPPSLAGIELLAGTESLNTATPPFVGSHG